MLGDIFRFRPSERGSHRTLVLLLVTCCGVTGGLVFANRPPESSGASPTVGGDLPRAPVSIVKEAPSPGPDAASLLPPTAPVTAPAVPVAPVPPPPTPAVAPPSASGAVAVRSPAARPDARPWIASSAPLAASPPIRVEIDAVGVSAPVGPLGLNRDGTLEVPTNFSRAGWYTGRPTPGETGPGIIVAHRASRRGPGAFWTLPAVRPGQEIVVTRADGRRVRFSVDRVEQHRKDAFPTAAVYGPTSEAALRLITCGGPFEPSLGDRYRDNVIVFARMTGWVA